jgi:hypothetical protein
MIIFTYFFCVYVIYLILGFIACYGKHDGDMSNAYKEWDKEWNQL